MDAEDYMHVELKLRSKEIEALRNEAFSTKDKIRQLEHDKDSALEALHASQQEQLVCVCCVCLCMYLCVCVCGRVLCECVFALP